MSSVSRVWRASSVVVPVVLIALAATQLNADWVARPGTVKVFARKKTSSPPLVPAPPISAEILRTLGAEVVDDQEAFLVLQVQLPNASASPLLLREVADTVEIVNEFDIVRFREYPIDAREPEPAYPLDWHAPRGRASSARDAFVIQFATVPRDSWLRELTTAGTTILDHVPRNGYVVLGDEAVLRPILDRLPVQVFRVHQPVHKTSARLRAEAGTFADAVISIASVPEGADAVSVLSQRALVGLRPPEPAGDRTIYRVTIDTVALRELAQMPAVLWMDSYIPPTPSGQREVHLAIGDTLATSAGGVLKPALGDHREWMQNKLVDNYKAAVGKMAILDTGFDLGSSTNVHPDFRNSAAPGNSFVEVRRYTVATGSDADCYGHGTFVAGILAGNAGGSYSTSTKDIGSQYNDNDYFMGLGLVPEMPLIVGRVFNYLSSALPAPLFNPQDRRTIYGDLAASGVAITSNSFNNAEDPSYSDESQLHDRLVRSANGVDGGPPMTIYFSGGNAEGGSDPPQYPRVSSPATAKNVISVGGSENFNPILAYPDPPFDPPYTRGPFADNGNEVWSRSQVGPTLTDGRIKPDVVAPTSAVEAPRTRNTSTCRTPEGNTQVGALIDPSSPDDREHLWSRGTSFSAPLAAGSGALLYTWFKNTTGTAPKPALLKAMQINLARELTAVGHPPNAQQGWGKVDLERAFETDGRYAWNNELPNTLLTSVGQSVVLPSAGATGYRIKDTSRPVRVTVVWTDRFGNPSAGGLVNNLDLTVRMQGSGAGSYAIGNDFNFATGLSNIRTLPLNGYDAANNVEQVVFTALDAGTDRFDVHVFAAALNGDAINAWSSGITNQQDFALFIENVIVLPAGATRFNTVAPCRVVDTRNSNGPYGGPALAGGSSRAFTLRGQCGIPPSAIAVSVNLTAIPTTDGYLTAYPGGAVPLVSTLSYRSGVVRANNAILTLGGSGETWIFSNFGQTHFLLDVGGYFD